MKKIYKDTNGRKYTRSRWIKIRQKYTRRGTFLFLYATDKKENFFLFNNKFKKNRVIVDYFRYKNHEYGMGEFYKLGFSIQIVNDEGIATDTYLTRYNINAWPFKHTFLEIKSKEFCKYGGEYVRVYEEVKQ